MFTGADNSCIQCTGCAMLSFRTYGLLNVLILLCKYSDLVIQCDHMGHSPEMSSTRKKPKISIRTYFLPFFFIL